MIICTVIGVRVMVFNATFNNISAISWWLYCNKILDITYILNIYYIVYYWTFSL